MWYLIDNLSPNKPCAINLSTVTNICWTPPGTLTFEFTDGQAIEVGDVEKAKFLEIVKKLQVVGELE